MQSKHQSLHLAFVAIFMATLAAQEVGATNPERAPRDSNGPTMDKPTYRTTSFVPRLGKREQKATALDRLKIDRLLCANYGLDCGRLLEELSRVTAPIVIDPSSAEAIRMRSNSNNSPLAALIDNLAQGIATQEGSLKLAATGNEPDLDVSLLDLLAQRLNARETRGSSDELFEFVGAGGTKRVAFTPRIG